MNPRYVVAALALFAGQLVAQTEFSQENATAILKHLCVEIGPRPMGSPAEQAALQYAVGKFREYGCDTAWIMRMDRSSRAITTSGIAIGIKRGQTGRAILVGGHMDSAGPEIPGADDDGSGSATVIELARVLGRRQLHSTVIFCCFGGEEQGLEGSRYFVEHYSPLDSIDLMLQIDMANGLGGIDIDPDTHLRSAPSWLVRAAVEEFYSLGYAHLGYPTHFFALNYLQSQGAGSDHEPFLDHGIPAIDFSTDVSKPIHTPRDNFANYDPAGMKRSGDVVLRLIERFDGGTPDRTMERYWLYLAGHRPVIVPLPALWIFLCASLLTAAVAFVMIRKRREPPDDPGRIRWSGMKVLLFTIIIVSCGWFSSDLIGLVRGVRHPWFTAIPWYYLLAAIAMMIGGWISLRLSLRLRLSRCPYVYFKRAAIILAAISVLCSLASVKLSVEPAVGLLLISLAILVRNPLLKAFFVGLSPWWMLRLIFSEWADLIFRSGGGVAGGFGMQLAVNAGIVLFFSLYILPFLYAVASVLRDSPRLAVLVPGLRKKGTLAGLGLAFAALSVYLLFRPVYDTLWYRDIHIDERYDMNSGARSVLVRSSEYLYGLQLVHNAADSSIDSRRTSVSLAPGPAFDTTWLRIEAQPARETVGGAESSELELILLAKQRPYTVYASVSSSPPGKGRLKDDYRWYSFPDTVIHVPVGILPPSGDSLTVSYEVVFDTLADPVRCEGDKIYVIPRTTYAGRWVGKSAR